MKCYLAVVAPESNSNVYVDLLEVALKSARLNTTLELCVLYDGPKNHRCYRLLNKYGVQIIRHKFSHEKEIYRLFDHDFLGRPMDPKKIVSAFMRMDIPFVEKKAEYVLYVDLDVLFTRDIREEDLPKPAYLAACGEFSPAQDMSQYFNAGVMVLNVRNMRRRCKLIFKDLENGTVVRGFDQGYLNKYCLADRTWLPVEYNWKPYWGINPEAAIIHYHGMKPGGTNEGSGFGMSDRVLSNTTRSGANLAGYAYYYALYFQMLGRRRAGNWEEWLARLLGKAMDLHS